MERRDEEQKRMKNDVRDLGFAGLKACGGLRDQVCIHQVDRVASEILDWSQWARAQHVRKKKLCQEILTTPDDPASVGHGFLSHLRVRSKEFCVASLRFPWHTCSTSLCWASLGTSGSHVLLRHSRPFVAGSAAWS